MSNIPSPKQLLHKSTLYPALAGNIGLKTKAEAEKVARWVMEKIKKGEMPPTVTIEEMKKLKAIK